MEDTSSSVGGRNVQRQEAQRRLLDAAVGQLADDGVRGLTHRKVERRAGVAQGSAKYYFGTLDALIEAVLEDLVASDLPMVLEVSPEEQAETVASGDLTALHRRAQQVVEAVAAQPDRVRARFHLYLHAASHPQLQPIVAAARDRFAARVAESMPGPQAEVGARFVCALMDGMLLDQLSAPSPTVDAHAARYVLAAGVTGAALAAETPDSA